MLGEYAMAEVELGGILATQTPKRETNGLSPMGSLNTITPRGNINISLAQASVQAK